jgi:SAM-dependent methyltransferase
MNFLVHDLEKLNKVSSPLDLILSNFTFQWVTNIDCVFETFVESLIPGGYFGIAVPIKGSLFEMHNSFKSTFDSEMPSLDYRNSDDYISALEQHAFSICTSQVEDICVSFYGIDALRYFKYTGTTFRNDPSHRPATIKEINKLLAYYEKKYGNNNKLLPLTFKVLFIIAQKKL